jgi:hypothetical protein
MEVAQAHDIPHRRAYDFFNFLTSFGVCSSTGARLLSWVGLSSIRETLAVAYAEIEVNTCDGDIQSVFCVGRSPTLGLLARRFVCLFFFLGVRTLSIRKATRFLTAKGSDSKSLDRRMYLVVGFLEALDIVQHTEQPSEYAIVIDHTVIMEQGMRDRRRRLALMNDTGVESLLSRHNQAFMNILYSQRQAEFDHILRTEGGR